MWKEDWQQEILPRLPEQLPEQAKALKAFERSRQIGSASALLRGLLAYVYTVNSFGHLAIWSVLIGLGNVSANDWRKRLRKSYAWLCWLLGELLAASNALSPWLLHSGLRRVLLIDGTHWSCPGPQGLIFRVHTAFDLLSGRLSQLKVTDTHEAEHLEVFELQEGDLVISDSANGYRERIAYACKRLAHLLVRFVPSTLPLEDAAGQAIDLLRWLKARHAPAGRICGLDAWITCRDGQRIPVRVVALRLSAEQREKAQRRKKQRSIRQQRKMRPETLYLSGWLLVVSTLPHEQWNDAAVLQLYRARWHIELVFKRIKQLLKLQRLRCTTKETAQATLTALLVGWALMEEESSAIRLAMAEAMAAVEAEPATEPTLGPASAGCWWRVESCGPLSEWMLAEVCFDLLCQQIRGHYTAARFRACLPQLQRFLCSGQRNRPHLYTQVCRWLGMKASGGDLLALAS
ncbi:MAG: transposase [Chloroflexi bacterium]|nr:transposase [Chloroflexota bacterium]